jgi:hypothetical protein
MQFAYRRACATRAVVVHDGKKWRAFPLLILFRLRDEFWHGFSFSLG